MNGAGDASADGRDIVGDSKQLRKATRSKQIQSGKKQRDGGRAGAQARTSFALATRPLPLLIVVAVYVELASNSSRCRFSAKATAASCGVPNAAVVRVFLGV